MVQESSLQPFNLTPFKEYFVQLYGWTFQSGHYRVAMELMACDLEAYLNWTSSWPLACSRHVTEQLLSGLQYMHGRGITHRDLKPKVRVLSQETYSSHKVAKLNQLISYLERIHCLNI